MKQFLSKVLLIASLLASPLWAHAQERVFSFPLIENDFEKYNAYLAGRNPLDLEAVKAEGLTRHNMELLVFQNALVLGGCDCRIVYTKYDVATTNARSLVDVNAGRLLSYPVAGFRSDSRSSGGSFFSEPVLEDDAFQVGLYTDASRKDVLSVTDPAQARLLTFVAAENWEIDIRVLKEKGLRFVTTSDWISALGLIRAGRADVIMQPFSSRPDLSFEDPQLKARFLPIPGLRMRFGHGRHYVVSMRHPEGPWFLQRLNAGLRKLRSSGKLAELQRLAGLTSERVNAFVEVR